MRPPDLLIMRVILLAAGLLIGAQIAHAQSPARVLEDLASQIVVLGTRRPLAR